jgi:hypothetical protein
MLRIDTSKKTLIALEPRTMRESGYWERRDIQEMICRPPDVFCGELGENIHILGSEVQPSEVVQDRIDLLGVDPDGAAVIIEIKRDNVAQSGTRLTTITRRWKCARWPFAGSLIVATTVDRECDSHGRLGPWMRRPVQKL